MDGPDDLLLKAAKSPNAFWNVLKQANKSKHGRKLLQRLFDQVIKGTVAATFEQRKALESYCD